MLRDHIDTLHGLCYAKQRIGIQEGTLKLGQAIVLARRKLQLTQKDLASRVTKEDGQPISPQYLNDIEHDRRSPSDYVLEQIAVHLKLDPGYLYFLAGQIPADLRETSRKPEEIQNAIKAFRKALKGNGHEVGS